MQNGTSIAIELQESWLLFEVVELVMWVLGLRQWRFVQSFLKSELHNVDRRHSPVSGSWGEDSRSARIGFVNDLQTLHNESNRPDSCAQSHQQAQHAETLQQSPFLSPSGDLLVYDVHLDGEIHLHMRRPMGARPNMGLCLVPLPARPAVRQQWRHLSRILAFQ